MAMSLFNPGPFTLADRQLCERVAAHYVAQGSPSIADAWARLAARIQRVLVGEFTGFSPADVSLVSRHHITVLRQPLVEGARAQSAALSRLGVLVLEASKGRLIQNQLSGMTGSGGVR